MSHRRPPFPLPGDAAAARDQEVIGLLKAQTGARGRRLEVVEVPAPTVLEADEARSRPKFRKARSSSDGGRCGT
ncbi:hypothetical protein ACF05L_28360 [Streptomyces bobili]|uniref:hypothetical protein n=1 Tax=Streptomyces bobili TaxID=67280 RepID=UPI0036FDE5B8